MHVLSRAVPTNIFASCVSKHVSPPYRRTNRIQIQIDAEVFFQYGALFVFPVHNHSFLKLAFFQIQCFFSLLHFNPSNLIIKVFACPWPSTWVVWDLPEPEIRIGCRATLLQYSERKKHIGTTARESWKLQTRVQWSDTHGRSHPQLIFLLSQIFTSRGF